MSQRCVKSQTSGPIITTGCEMSEDTASIQNTPEPEDFAAPQFHDEIPLQNEVIPNVGDEVPLVETVKVDSKLQGLVAEPQSLDEPKGEAEDDFDDDDFGSFDEASFEEFQAPELQTEPTGFSSISLDNIDTVDNELQKIMDQVFPDITMDSEAEAMPLIPDTLTLFSMLSKNPRLNPPNWIKLKIRHSLLIKLGVPINLDELDAPLVTSAGQTRGHSRRRSINVNDIDWEHYDIPEFSALGISPDEKQGLVTSTHEELSRIEADIMNNTSELFLQSSSDESLESKLAQMQQNYAQLIKLSSVWQDQIRELQDSQEIYESVVQNMVGYSQKLQRNEILESLKRAKTKKGKRTF